MAAALATIPIGAISPTALGQVAKTKSILTGDLVVIHGHIYRKIKSRAATGKTTKTGRPQYKTVEVLDPIDIEGHVNPMSLMIGGIALAGAALFAAIAWYGVKVPTLLGEVTVIHGVKDNILGYQKSREKKKEEKTRAKEQTPKPTQEQLDYAIQNIMGH
jgi:hypothetical protein